MALRKDFPKSPHAILAPAVRWFPDVATTDETTIEKLMPPLVALVIHTKKNGEISEAASAKKQEELMKLRKSCRFPSQNDFQLDERYRHKDVRRLRQGTAAARCLTVRSYF